MTTITLPRATVEQALEALKDDQYRLVEVGPNQYEYKTDLAIAALERALAQQAEPVSADAAYQRWLADTHAPALRRMDSQGAFAAGWQAALAQQAEQAWVCPDSPEHRYAKPGHCEDCGKTLVQEQGCDHCNHPLYAATKCRVCGRVTEQAEPVEPVAWLTPRNVDSYSRPDLGYETSSKTDYGAFPVYTAPPQRKED